MSNAIPGNHLRHHRKKAGLSQRELGRILGYGNEGTISRHEESRSIPPLLSGLGYEVVFGASISSLFPGLRKSVEQAIEQRLRELEHELQDKARNGVRASLIAQKLAWLDERRALLEE